MRATIMVSADQADEVAAPAALFGRWQSELVYCSENQGCGCCIDTWDVDVPAKAVAEIPAQLNAMTDWSHPEVASLPLRSRHALRNEGRYHRKRWPVRLQTPPERESPVRRSAVDRRERKPPRLSSGCVPTLETTSPGSSRANCRGSFSSEATRRPARAQAAAERWSSIASDACSAKPIANSLCTSRKRAKGAGDSFTPPFPSARSRRCCRPARARRSRCCRKRSGGEALRSALRPAPAPPRPGRPR